MVRGGALMHEYDIVIIGGGPAGLAAAVRAKELGINKILILEREDYLGGILNQCIHNGFGEEIFGEEFTGPEYAEKFIKKVNDMGIDYRLNTTVYDINKDKDIWAVNEDDGVMNIRGRSIILATGCRERPRGAINIAGSKIAGIFTAGMIQKFINLEGYLPGKEVIILGSGNVALVMARRLVLEGAKVKAIVESMPSLQGDYKYIKDCVEDFKIPVKLSRTVVELKGKDRVEGITIAQIDDEKNHMWERSEFISCDTIVLSVELYPDNELAIKAGIEMSDNTKGPMVGAEMNTNLEGIYACGDLLYPHEKVDRITEEGYKTAESVRQFLRDNK